VTRPPRILILGGGYVAITLTRELRPLVRRGAVDVTVVSRDNFHVFHGFIGEMVTGRIGPSNLLSPVRRIFAPAKVHVAEVERIDLEQQRVVTSRHLDGARFELEYDHAVLCLGSAEDFSRYPGLAEHAFRLKAYRDCFALRNHILEMFELAEIETDPEERRRLLTFVVCGGGYAGAEIAGELADFVGRLTTNEYRQIAREECRVVLVHRGNVLLPELYGSHGVESQGKGRGHPSLVAYATRHLLELGVEPMLETDVVSATPNEVRLQRPNGPLHVPTRTIISAVGTRMPPVLEALPLDFDARGRIVTEDTLQVPGHENLWAAGDCAAVAHPKGGTCPSVGIYALKHGTLVGKNLKRALAGDALKPFRYPGLAQGVSIGRRTAVGEVKGVRIRGLLAWLVWRSMLFYFFPSWDRRLHLLADWTIWPFVGRDTVQMVPGRGAAFDVHQNLFQPGETILSRGRGGRFVHVIVDGDVQLVRSEAGGELVLRTLGPGGHFGRRALERDGAEFARAHTVVRTLGIEAEHAHALRGAMRESLGSTTPLGVATTTAPTGP